MLIMVLCFGFIAITCNKGDDGTQNVPGPQNQTTCQVSSQSGFDYVPDDTLAQTTYDANWSKIISSDGKVQKLSVVVVNYFGDIDSVTYDLTYETAKVNVSINSKSYERNDEGVLVFKSNGNFNGSISLNSDGYATQYGEMFFVYEGKKLVGGTFYSDGFELATYTYDYDEHGNVTSMKQHVQGIGFKEVRYEYDYSKEAKAQFYVGVGRWFLVDPSILELMGLLPLPAKHLRKTHWLFRHFEERNVDTTYMKLNLTNHSLDGDGFLKSFNMTDGDKINQTITNEVECVTN